MSAKTLIFKSVTRRPVYGPEDHLELKPGVNVLVGPAMSGKTRWLRMIDYLLGDRGKIQDAIGSDLAQKYQSIEAVVVIDGEEISLERRWKEKGSLTKVFVNGNPMLHEDLSDFLLNKLDMPILKIPGRGTDSPSSWPALSFRELLRHMYRKEHGWGGIAPEQPPRTQHACVMLFVGTGELLYSDEYGVLVLKRQELAQVRKARDQFTEIFDQLYQHIVEDEGLTVSPTSDSMLSIIEAFRSKLSDTRKRRDEIMTNLMSDASRVDNAADLERLTEVWRATHQERQEQQDALRQSGERIQQLTAFQVQSEREITRLSQISSIGLTLADLKVTNCPVCDQEVEREVGNGTVCFLCKQPHLESADVTHYAEERIDFEREQLAIEISEVKELIVKLREGEAASRREIARLDQILRESEAAMQPIREAAAAIIPPELARLDTETGRLQEQVRVLERLISMLDRRDEWADRVDDVSAQIAELESSVAAKGADLRLESKAKALSDGMNTYLNAINSHGVKRWRSPSVSVTLNRTSFDLRVGKDRWSSKLSGTTTLFLFMAYHYSLLNLTHQEGYFYPGLTIIDVPPVLHADAVREQENFAFEPFIDLLSKDGLHDAQVIAAGASFEGLQNVNRIQMQRVWEETEIVQLNFDDISSS